MNATGWLARRTLTALLAALAVLTITYVAVTVAPPYRAWPGAETAGVQQLPTFDEYVGWLTGLITLEWGTSSSLRAPVADLVMDGVKRTGAYVLPALFLSTGLGALIGLRSATGEETATDRATNFVAYLAFGLPNFFVGVLLLLWFSTDGTGKIIHRSDYVHTIIWPSLLLTTTLTAAGIRYTRTKAAEYAHSDLVRLVRSAGGRRRDVARHVLRNAAVPLLSLFFTELLGVLLLNIYVIESVFSIRGVGYLNFYAVQRGDVSLVVGTTVVFVLAGVLGNYFQDVAYATLDPRVEADRE